jgi:hypothetical protein
MVRPGVVTKCLKFATEMMRPGAGLHADEARRQIGKSRFHLATRPLLAQHQGSTPATLLLSFWDTECSLSWVPPRQLGAVAGREHGRTIPFTDLNHAAETVEIP